MRAKVFTVLFICRHNAVRSQMAEVLLRSVGRRRFAVYSAGTEPAAALHPLTLETIRNAGLRADGLAPKGLERFVGSDGPALHFAVTLCEDSGRCRAPLAGRPMRAHWPFPDPTLATGGPAERAAIFAETFRMIRGRLELFAELPVEGLDRLTLQRRMDELGRG